ncbi:YpfB family protein [Cytobacillus spongiae]|uniref:YpfB family protein n=1 Tax=Cytobacillus spongiae TaxID=2901381 RepID=UPI001F1E50D4|nr:YpfB family protein [Cytobacillus spongiae]UII54656.1 YpfB family protein [Cytobacillus spongiae]
MMRIERLLIKLVAIQLLFLLATQIFFHKMNVVPELKQITQYEGVTESNFTKLLETFNGRFQGE